MMAPVTYRDVRVVKIGGSLLDSTAVEQLPDWLRAQPPKQNVLIVGGGARVDSIRRSQTRLGLSDRDAHWLSIAAMRHNARSVALRLQNVGVTTPIATSVATIIPPTIVRTQGPDRSNERPVSLSIFEVEPLLRGEVNGNNALPQDWTVTSDSIAARVADVLGADELVLLKSVLPSATTLVESCRDGFVDDYFLSSFRCKKLRIVNARDENWSERTFAQNV